MEVVGAVSGGSRERDPVVLLAHDGELDDVRTLLREGGPELVEYRCTAPPDGAGTHCSLVVATPKRMLELGLEPDSKGERVHVVIGDAESKTLRKTMSRIGVDFFVWRPVHPDALRLLLLHVLYRGPEKRRARRVQIGAPAHYRSGLRKRPAMLLDLSISGCRLLLFEPGVEQGVGLTVFVPADRDGSQYLKVRGEVIRFSRAPSDREGGTAHVAFDALPAKLAGRLQQAVDEFAEGPSSLEAALAEQPAAVGATQQDEPELPELASWENPEPGDVDEALPEDGQRPEGDDRRTEPRRIFTRRIVTLREDKARVLIGRDLSPGGMRTDPDPNLELGDEISLALPLRADHVPLIVRARVIRNDAGRGLVLQFVDLSEQHAAFLKQHATLLPICDSPYAEEEPACVIVSEILDS